MVRLSIIIPVYNVEEYISKCILSLQDQDILKEEYEIIIVNDGSPDNSREIVLGLMKTFNNIVFIEQENKGVSVARNVGINKAVGRYLLFIDPDDYIFKHSLARVLNEAEKYNTQVAFLGYQYLSEDNSVKASYLFSEQKEILHSGIEAYHISMKGITIDPDRSWAILYERQYINENKLRFTPNIPYLEDGEFMARVLCLAKRCIFEGNPFYIRTVRPGSATNSGLFYSPKAINGFFNATNNLKTFKSTYNLNTLQRYHINQPITKFTLLIVQACVQKGFYTKFKEIKKRLKTNHLNKIEIKGCSTFYYKYGLIYNISNDLFYYVWGIRLLFISLNVKLRNAFKNFSAV